MEAIVQALIKPLNYPFMMRGFIASVLVGITCAVLGSYVVLRGMAFLGDALAHAILPGIAIAYLGHWPLFSGALAVGVLTALGIGYLTQRGRVKEDTAIGVIFAGAFALGIALLSTVKAYATDLMHILFGNVLGVSVADLWLIGGLGALVILLILALYKEFLVLSFDPALATTFRLPVSTLRYLLLIMIAVTIVISLRVVGVALVMAMLVTPAATAYLLTRRLPAMMCLSAIIGAVSAMIGLYASFYLNIASGAAVVLVATVFFLLALISSPRRRRS